MEFIAIYSEMDYVIACHTGLTKWYTNIYNKMVERDECTLQTSRLCRWEFEILSDLSWLIKYLQINGRCCWNKAIP